MVAVEIEYALGIERVSSDKQGLIGDSPKDQRKSIKHSAELVSSESGKKVVFVKWFTFVESASGELEMQPVLEVIEYVKNSKKKIKWVFVKNIGRLTRAGSIIYGSLKMQLARYGAELIDVQGVIGRHKINTLAHLDIEYPWSTFNPTWITEMLEAERYKSEVRDILTRMIGAEINYVRMGYSVRRAPLGLRNKKVETPHGLRVVREAHPVESLWIIRMFELRIQGNLSDEQILKKVNDMGFRTRKFKLRDSKDKRKTIGEGGGNPLKSVKQLRRYIENPIYAGVNNENWVKDNPVKCKHFAGLVTIEQFNRANRGKISIVEESGKISIVRGKPSAWSVKRLKDNPKYPYKKHILCPICRKPLLASSPRSKSGKHISTYHCSRNHKYWGINSNKLNEKIESFVNGLSFSRDFRDKFRKIFLEEWEKREKQVSDDAIDFGKKIAQKEYELRELKEKLKVLTSHTAIKMIEEDIEKTQQDKANLMQKRDNKEDEQLDIQTVLNRVSYYMEHLEELILSGTDSLKNAEMFGLVFEEKPTYEELVNGTPKLAPIFALKEAFDTSERQFVTLRGIEPRFAP